jgi:hypothetical protein
MVLGFPLVPHLPEVLGFFLTREKIYRTIKKNYKCNFYGNYLAVDE